MRHPHGETVSVKPYVAGAKNSHNNPVDEWGDPVDYPGCAVAPGSSSESITTDQATTFFTVYGPYEMVVGPKDLIVLRGLEYNVEGQPEHWKSPFNGSTPGCVVTIRRTNG